MRSLEMRDPNAARGCLVEPITPARAPPSDERKDSAFPTGTEKVTAATPPDLGGGEKPKYLSDLGDKEIVEIRIPHSAFRIPQSERYHFHIDEGLPFTIIIRRG